MWGGCTGELCVHLADCCQCYVDETGTGRETLLLPRLSASSVPARASHPGSSSLFPSSPPSEIKRWRSAYRDRQVERRRQRILRSAATTSTAFRNGPLSVGSNQKTTPLPSSAATQERNVPSNSELQGGRRESEESKEEEQKATKAHAATEDKEKSLFSADRNHLQESQKDGSKHHKFLEKKKDVKGKKEKVTPSLSSPSLEYTKKGGQDGGVPTGEQVSGGTAGNEGTAGLQKKKKKGGGRERRKEGVETLSLRPSKKTNKASQFSSQGSKTEKKKETKKEAKQRFRGSMELSVDTVLTAAEEVLREIEKKNKDRRQAEERKKKSKASSLTEEQRDMKTLLDEVCLGTPSV